jgi:membrane-associated phospholipid phosphatase
MVSGEGSKLDQRTDLVLLGVTLAVSVAGVTLYAAGFNEGFYSGSEGVRSVFEVLTNIGDQAVYLVLLGIIYLSYDKGLGRRMCLLFFFIVYLTAFLKQLFHDPRPRTNLEMDDPYTSYGFPSGHTTTSVTFYGYLMLDHLGRSRWRVTLTVLLLFAMVAVPFSRMVIGVHDLQDVVGGAVIALLTLIAYRSLLPRVVPVVKGWSVGEQVLLGACLALLLWLGGTAVLALRHPGEALVSLEELSMGAGLLLGCAIAFPLEETYVDYRPEGLTTGRRALAALIGLPVTILVYEATSLVSDMLLPGHVADLLTYAVLIVVLTLLVPMMLKRLLAVG